WSMAIHIPPILVVIACKVVMAANPDPNAAFTHVENTQWATGNSMMVCQRHEVELYDPVEGMQLNQTDNPLPRSTPTSPTMGNACAPALRWPSTGIRHTTTRRGACGALAAPHQSSISGQER